MATSKFVTRRIVKVAPPKEDVKNKYNFAGGEDSLTALEEMADNTTPYSRNARNVHQGSIGKRKGIGFYSTPGDETLQISQITTTGAADLSITTTQWQAATLVPSSNTRLTRLDLNVKYGTTAANAPLIVEIWQTLAGVPTVKIATSSISVSSVASSYAYIPVRFEEAPQLTSGATYWIITYLQNTGTGSYLWSSSNAYAGKVSANSGVTWTATQGGNYKSYMSTPGGALGRIRIRFSSGTKATVFARTEAAGTTGVYLINDITGALTAIKTGLSSSATDYQFAFGNDILYFVNGVDAPQQWDGTTETTVPNAGAVAGFPPVGAIRLTIHKNRLFFLENSGRVVFSDAGDFTTYQSVSFFYVPTPKPRNPVNSMFVFQDFLWFGTNGGPKYYLQGSDLSSFVLRVSTAVKSMISQNTVAVDGNYFYFWSTDNQLYSCNGATDTLISKAISLNLQALTNYTTPSLIVYQNNLRFYFAETGSAYNNAMYLLDLVNGGWFRDDNFYISGAVKLDAKGDSQGLVEFSSLTGTAFYAEVGYSDLGRPIKLTYYDKPETFGAPGVRKEIIFYYPEFVAQTVSTIVDCQVDKDLQNQPVSYTINVQGTGALWGTAIWGSFTWGSNTLVKPTIPVTGEWRYFQNRYICDGADTPCELRGYSSYYLVKTPY